MSDAHKRERSVGRAAASNLPEAIARFGSQKPLRRRWWR